jgi:hypothetical protein
MVTPWPCPVAGQGDRIGMACPNRHVDCAGIDPNCALVHFGATFRSRARRSTVTQRAGSSGPATAPDQADGSGS